MTVISFEGKRARINLGKKVKANVNSPNETSDESLPECSSTEDIHPQLSHLSTKVVHLTHFIRNRHKQNIHWENVKLRNGLVLKIHDARRNAEQALKNYNENQRVISEEQINFVQEEILELASEYADFALYGEASTIELLNSYWEFKNVVDQKVKELANFGFGDN
jgi:hypothetical protein